MKKFVIDKLNNGKKQFLGLKLLYLRYYYSYFSIYSKKIGDHFNLKAKEYKNYTRPKHNVSYWETIIRIQRKIDIIL